MMSDAVFGALSSKRSLIGVLLGSAKSIARLRLRRRHSQILGGGLNYSEIEVAAVESPLGPSRVFGAPFEPGRPPLRRCL